MATDEVHVHHCCQKHGCKYGDDTRWDESLNSWITNEDGCPVTTKRLLQKYLCEQCVEIKEALEEIKHLQEEIAWVEEFNARSVQ